MMYFTRIETYYRIVCATHILWCFIGMFTQYLLHVKGEEQHYQTVCEHEYMQLRCQPGRYISVSTAVYGRQDEATCYSETFYTTDCAAVGASQLVQNVCNGKNTCEVHASNDVFGDPCEGTHKYLAISYNCIEGYCQEYHTTFKYNYTFIPRIPNHAESFTFKVRANNDAYVALAAQPLIDGTRSILEIGLGVKGNRESHIRECAQCGDATYAYTPDILSPDEDRHFIIKFTVAQESTPTYLGCYVDSSDRVLPNHLYKDRAGMTLEKCWSHCRSKDQIYAGLQNSNQCFCGTEDAEYYRYGQVLESDCDSICSGNDEQLCGAAWRNSVYYLADGELTVGLVGDEVPFMSYRYNPNSFQFNYIGILTADEGNGNWTFCNYIPTPAYLGCYIDNADRALPNNLYEDHGGMTLEKCWSHCRSVGGQSYAGLQYSYHCFCGTEDPDYFRYGKASEADCSSLCGGNYRQQCGGGWRNSVYDLGGTSTIRLVGGTKSSEGRLELYHSGVWSTVCRHGWNPTNAHVACRMLGYPVSEDDNHDTYGEADGAIILNSVQCSGEEKSLFECHHDGLYNHACTHADDVSLRCRSWEGFNVAATQPGDDKGGGFPFYIFGIIAGVGVVWLISVRKRSQSPPGRTNPTATNPAPNTVSASVSGQEQNSHQVVEMSDNALPSYDAAVEDSSSQASIIDSNVPPYNLDVYNASEIEDPNLPPPPSYHEAVSKSNDFQVPIK